MKPSRLTTLTSLRYLFAAAVVAFHLVPAWAGAAFLAWPARAQSLLNFACLALPFFFTLSGFVLYYTYRRRSLGSRGARLRFWGRRFARIAPVFYLALAAGLSERIARDAAAGKILPDLLANATFLAAWMPDTLAINFSTWSISVEAFCYLLFPFLLGPVSRLPLAAAGAGLAGVYFLGASFHLGAGAVYPALWEWPGTVIGVPPALASFLEVHPLVHFPEFAFGLLLGRVWEERGAARSDLLLVGGIVFILALLASGVKWPFLMLTSFLFLPAIALMLLGGAGPRGRWMRWLESGWAAVLGEASYAIYGLHMPLAFWFARAIPVAANPGAWFLVFFGGLTLVGVGVHLWLELPARRWLNSRLGGGEA